MALGSPLLQNYFSGCAEYLVVNEDHDSQRYIEGKKRSVYLVAKVLAYEAMFTVFVPVAEE